ncbi:MAG: D-isomer specific 2-hydroxyacid dehydrogenase family protein [Lachnospiraceae bacterium]|nr:D-isomer specific 2-hydroxyacid dehydrogenase family protein [Lachnospiraceae bacterium]
MFEKLVAIEPVSLVADAEKRLYDYAKEVVLFTDIPADNDEIIRRIGDADAVLLSYTSRIDRYVLERCAKIKYIGMCCSLYSEASANVDIAFAREKGITVLGIRDYGDRGVVEFVLSELIRLLHGYDRPMWKELPEELTGLKVGIIGLGVSGGMIADALQFMGAKVSYFSRSRKPEREAAGIAYQPMEELLSGNDVLFTCLNKNVILLHEKEFAAMGNGKILFNTSIGPSHEVPALLDWLNQGDNYFICDTVGALGDEAAVSNPHIFCANVSAGRTRQAFELLSEKVLANLEQASC